MAQQMNEAELALEDPELRDKFEREEEEQVRIENQSAAYAELFKKLKETATQ